MSNNTDSTLNDNKSSSYDDSISNSNECCDGVLPKLIEKSSVYGLVASYCISVSFLSITNKWAILKFPHPAALTALQYITGVLVVLMLGHRNVIEHDSLTFNKMWKFLPAAIVFDVSLFLNSEVLLHANVSTFIVFRSAVPVLVAVGETLLLKQPWPSFKTWYAHSMIFVGSIVYAVTNHEFRVESYSWAIAYLAGMAIEFVYIKLVVMAIDINLWGLVLYKNLNAFLLFPFELIMMRELNDLKDEITDEHLSWYSIDVAVPVGLSFLFSLSTSFFGFACRKSISATGFTVLGIANKLGAVLINLVIWDMSSRLLGTLGLLTCIFGSVQYQLSNTKSKNAVSETEMQLQSRNEHEQLGELQLAVEIDGAITKHSVSLDRKCGLHLDHFG